jgi:KaiC/GvpD/RAD55 family RecA-like ATPase
MIRLIARVSTEDPFHGTNIRTAALTVTNSSGFQFIKNVPMNLTSETEMPSRVDYVLPITIPSGCFNFTVDVGDVANRIFRVSKNITITSFHTLGIMLLDSKRRPLPGVNITLSVGDQLIDEIETDSSGTAASEVPSSPSVGPLTLEAKKNGLVVLSRVVEVQSNLVIQLEVPLYDWDVAVRLPIVNSPIMGAQVNLYLNGTSVASADTDTNGLAHFLAVPLGSYDVKVASFVGTSEFTNVTHTAGQTVAALEVPVMSEIPESALLAVAGVAIVAVFAAATVSRRRRRTRRYKRVADLLGGTALERAVIMVVGPSGSGKSLLMLNILADSLQLGRRCLHVSNSELPSRIRDQLAKMGVDVHDDEQENKLRFVDAYSGEVGTRSSEMHAVSSPRDLTGLGIQITSCVEELGGTADVFLDSLGPIVESGGLARGLEFVRYYGARTTKSGGTFTYATTAAIGQELLDRLEESSDCVVQVERAPSKGRIRGRLLVKKARGLAHEEGWFGFKITSRGRMEFSSLPSTQS